MNLNNGIGEQAINKTIEEHPVIGEILQKYDIGVTVLKRLDHPIRVLSGRPYPQINVGGRANQTVRGERVSANQQVFSPGG